MGEIRVLIVDDCVDFTMLLSEYLRKQKGIIIVGEATNGIEALKILSEEEVDIVLLDIEMPQMDGFSMLQEMRKTPNKHAPKVIIVSALPRDEFIKQAIDLGAFHYMIKPFDINALLTQIREIAKQTLSYKEPISQANLSAANILDERIHRLLLIIGIPKQSLGLRYLQEAINMAIADHGVLNRLTKRMYPAIGRHFNTTASRVERAMRYAIESAWNRGEKELSRIFGYKATIKEDKPTNREFIAVIAENMIS